MGFIDEKVDKYITELLPINDPFLEELYLEGIADDIPIIQVPSLKLIETVFRLIQPKVIIEVGAAIGFSTIWLAKAFPNATIHTIERKKEMIERAKINIEKSGLSSQIILHEGDALEILPRLPKADVIFIDAAKGKYKEFYDLAFPLVPVGGVIIFDNILFRGYVADEEIANSKPMLRKIKGFNEIIAKDKRITSSFIPIGDGLAICYKMEETT